MAFLRRVVARVHPIVRSVPRPLHRQVFNRVFFSDEYNFLYFRVPKAANSTVMLSLAKVMAPGLLDATGGAAKRAAQDSLKLPLFFRNRVEKSYKFTFVRNPYSRLLSIYLDKIAPGTAGYRRKLDTDDHEMSFLEFLKRLDGGYLTADIHWAPQSCIVPRPPSELDFIGRVENLEADLQHVMNRIFGERDHEIVRRTVGATSATSRIDEAYGEEEGKLVRKMYAKDFELFYPELLSDASSSPDSADRAGGLLAGLSGSARRSR